MTRTYGLRVSSVNGIVAHLQQAGQYAAAARFIN
tara:strand:- start:956 stop:1057 length:102 start_codon:yes stop_codon:yes gene_type:complete